MSRVAGLVVVIVSWFAADVGAQPAVELADFDPLVERLEAAVRRADPSGYFELLADDADRAAAGAFAETAFRPGVEAAVVQARFLSWADPESEADYMLTVEVFTDHGMRGRLQTWRLDMVAADPPESTNAAERAAAPGGAAVSGPWRIADQESVDTVDGLVHLTLNPDIRYDATNLVVAAEDLSLRMARGSVFVAESFGGGVTALVLVGDGEMSFTPQLAAEQGQVRILTDRERLDDEFSAAFVRVNPAAFAARVSNDTLTRRPPDRGAFERAREIFDEFSSLSFVVELDDLTDKTWSLTPNLGDLLAEVRTRRYGTLTYAQASSQPEDITLFERARQRIISMYASPGKRAERGRYYSDRDRLSYDIIDYRLDLSLTPRGVTQDSLRARPRLRGCFIEGTARLSVQVTGPSLSSLTLRLADALDVLSVTSPEFGPMLFLRMQGQNNLVVNLPRDAPSGTEFTIDVTYTGLLPGQELDENWIGRSAFIADTDSPFGVAVPRYIYSNSSYWYPQSIASDFATGILNLSVPADYGLLASGEPDTRNPPVWPDSDGPGYRRYRFVTVQPARYFSCIITRFAEEDSATRMVAIDPATASSVPVGRGVWYDSVALSVWANERNRHRVAPTAEDARDILRFYGSLVGDMPYPTFMVALTDAALPGGHAPAYFAVMNQPLPIYSGRMLSWRTDPVAFSGYPTFFLAHELAHQWWGQAVGWKNYHEQWLSEGLAQYFAAMYAEHRDGPDVFNDVVSQMRRWSLRHSEQGPVYLGNRLGRLEDEPRVFRALVYNKAAMVLHMLRRTLGDDTFLRGLRRFYQRQRFTNAGTDDLIRAFEDESGRPLAEFFERWIHDAALPDVTFSYDTDTAPDGTLAAVLRFEQVGPPFEMPVTVTLRYRDGQREDIVVTVAEAVTEVRVPIRGPLRDVSVNQDDAALAEIE